MNTHTTTNNAGWLPPLRRESEGVFIAEPIASGGSRVFGGEMMAQSVDAAARVLPGFRMHAVSTQFLRTGDLEDAMRYRVEVLSQGRRFARAEVRAIQRDRIACISLLSLATDTQEADRLSDPVPVPQTPAMSLDSLKQSHPDLARILARPDAIDKDVLEISEDGRCIVYRFRPHVPGPVDGTQMATYASDRMVMSSAQLSSAISAGLGTASGLGQITLNHELRIHRHIDAARPLYQRIRTEIWGVGRVYCTGVIFDDTGTRLASFTQEGLIG